MDESLDSWIYCEEISQQTGDRVVAEGEPVAIERLIPYSRKSRTEVNSAGELVGSG